MLVDINLIYTYADNLFEAIFSRNGSTLTIKEKFKQNSTSKGHSNWKLVVPENIAVKINSGSGDINLVLKSKLNNDITITSGSGSATLDFNGLAIEDYFTMKANKRHGVITAPFDFDETTEEGSGNQTIINPENSNEFSAQRA